MLTSVHLAVWVLRRIIATGFQTWLTKPYPASSLLGGRSRMHAALFNWAGACHHVLTLQGHTTMFLLLQGTPQPSWPRWAFFFLFFHKFFFLQLWWCCRAIVVTARLLLRSLLTFNVSVLFFVGVLFMFFHKFHFICCDVVDDPTGKKERLSWV
jgi:hypothetical protein